MKYIKYVIRKTKKILRGIFYSSLPVLFIVLILIFSMASDGYTLADLGFEEINLNPNDYCNLTDIEYTAVLTDEPDGSARVDVVEYITFDIHAASSKNPFKEVWRELPEEYIDGAKRTYNVRSVTQITKDGEEITYTETPKMYWEDYDYTESSTYYWHHSDGSGRYPDNDESLLIYIPWTTRDKLTFKIEYSMNNAALKYNDCSELYLSMYYGKTIRKLNSFKANILVPDHLMPRTYNVYTMGSSNEIKYTESNKENPGYHTFKIDLNKSQLKFNKTNEYIEFSLLAFGEDKHIFTQFAPDNYYTDEDALNECIAENEYYATLSSRSARYKFILLVISIPLCVVIIIATKNKYIKARKSHTFYEPDEASKEFTGIPSNLDPIFASQLVFMKDPFNENMENSEEYSALLLSLVRKGYVSISKIKEYADWSENNTYITLEHVKSVTNNPAGAYSSSQTNSFGDNTYTSQTNNYGYTNPTDIFGYSSTTNSSNSWGYNPYPNQSNSFGYNPSASQVNNLGYNTSSNNQDAWQYSKDTPVPEIKNINADTGVELPKLTTSERLYYELLVRESSLTNSFTLSHLQMQINNDYYTTEAFVKDIEKKPALECGVMEGYFTQTDYDVIQKKFIKSAKNSLIVSLILLTVVNFISSYTIFNLGYGAYTILGLVLLWRFFYLTQKSGDVILFSQLGVNEQRKWINLYNYLNNETEIKSSTASDLSLWEDYLIYATAFGIAKHVVGAIKIKENSINIDDSRIIHHHSYIHSRHRHSISRGFGRSLHTASRGGGFGGHGYSGGGRRRRRWRRPLI